jgi:hypothetical protein
MVPQIRLGHRRRCPATRICERIEGSTYPRSYAMELDVLLAENESSVLDEAYSVLERSHVAHYEAAGEGFTRDKLADLFALVVDAIRSKNLARIGEYSEEVAVERFGQGFDISEVQAAYNALEESMWRQVIAGVPADDLPEAIGLLSTVLGFGKDALARTYVSQACKRHVPSLDLKALFAGATS